MFENIWSRWNVSQSDAKGGQWVRRNWAEHHTNSRSSMKTIFKLHLSAMVLLLLLLNTFHFVRKIAARRSFPWFSHFSPTSQAWGLLFPSHYCPGPPSAQTGCFVCLKQVQNLGCQGFFHPLLQLTVLQLWFNLQQETQVCLGPTSQFILSVVGLKIKHRIWGEIFRRDVYSRTADAAVFSPHVTVCASLSLRSFSSTKLHLTITFGVCCRAVSSASAVRRLNFTPSVSHPRGPDWQASCSVCIWLPQCAANLLLPQIRLTPWGL